MKDFATGSVAGTGAAIIISVGWVPDYVKCVNVADAGNLDPVMEWFAAMGAGKGLKYLRVADNATTGNLSHRIVTTNGITAFAGSQTAAPGFTIGTDSDLNTASETIIWIAFRA